VTRGLLVLATPDGTTAFDVEPSELALVGPERVSRQGDAVVARLETSVDEALASARPAAAAVVRAFRELAPQDVEVEFGLRIDAEAGAVFARAGVGAHFTVKLKWSS
jgi:hypothetical protein